MNVFGELSFLESCMVQHDSSSREWAVANSDIIYIYNIQNLRIWQAVWLGLRKKVAENYREKDTLRQTYICGWLFSEWSYARHELFTCYVGLSVGYEHRQTHKVDVQISPRLNDILHLHLHNDQASCFNIHPAANNSLHVHSHIHMWLGAVVASLVA